MKKFKFLFLFFLLVASGQLLVANPASAAEVEVYPGPGVVGIQANATSDGWTDNHLVGQSFTPQNINKVTKIKLTNFKLGKEGQNNGGIVTVSLYQGEPTVRTVGPSNYQVTEVSPTGPLIARVEKVYIPGWKLSHWFADLCGAEHNSAEDYLLKRIRINNPDKPCPKVWIHNGVPGTGESDLLGPADVNDPIYQGESLIQGPGGLWEARATGWQSDTNLTVNFPSNGLTPGQTYYLQLKQSYLKNSEYYEEYKHNCEGPVNLYDSSGAVISNRTEVCDKSHVFVAGIDTNNPYAGGRAYFNTYYYLASGYQPATGDLTNLKIWGNQAFPPTASIYGLTAGTVSQTLNYLAGAGDKDGNLTRGEIWVTKNDFTTWTSSCPGTISGGIWCNLANTTLSGGSGAFSGSWTPSATGIYYAVVNAFDLAGGRCTGNPQYSFNGGTIVNASWSDCTSNDYLTVSVAQPVKISTTSKVSVTNNPNVAAGFQGTPSTSGRQLADGGANWYNFMTVTEQIDVSGTTGSNIDLAIAAFLPQIVSGRGPYPNDPGLNNLWIAELTSDLGFVLAYAQNNTPNSTDSLIEGSSDNSQFLAGHYYVHYKVCSSCQGRWKDMGDPVADRVDKNFCIDSGGNPSLATCGSNGKIQVTGRVKSLTDGTPYVSVSSNSLTVKWDVYTWPSFASKKLETYGFAQVREAGGGLRIMQIPL